MEVVALIDPKVLQFVVAALLAVFGALARRLRLKEKKAMRMSNIVSGCFIAAFAGILGQLLAESFSLNTNLSYILAAVCGWTGPQILDGFASMIVKKMGLEVDKQITEGQKDQESFL